jgi:hypothetical protein
METKNLMKSFLLAAAAGGIALSASGQLIWSDDFDSHAPGNLTPQGGWTSVTATSAQVSTDQASSGSNSVFIAGTLNNSEQRNQITFAATGTPNPNNIVVFSFDFYDTNPTGPAYRQHVNLQEGAAPSGSAQLIGMGLNNNIASNYYMGRVLGFNGGAYFRLDDPGAPTRTMGWVNLKVEISDSEFRFYVNDILSKTVVNSYTLRSYDTVRLGSGLSNANNAAYYDNFMIYAIPEPGTYAAIFGGLALLGAFVYRRRLAKK